MRTQSTSILFVDDDRFYSHGYCEELEEHFNVTYVNTAFKAESQLLAATQYQCAILDVMMAIPSEWPESDKQAAQDGLLTGLIILRRCKSRIIEANLPIVVLTNRQPNEIQVAVKELGFPDDLIIVCFKADTPKGRLVNIVRRIVKILPPIKRSQSSGFSRKAIVSLDLYKSSLITDDIEGQIGEIGLPQLEKQILSFIQVGLDCVKIKIKESLISMQGDGCILMFDTAEQAHQFAESVQLATQQHNGSRRIEGHCRWFRIGAATKTIYFEKKKPYSSAIAHAVRLQSAANPGGILIDVPTYATLPLELQDLYGEMEVVCGKEHEETFEAYRYQFIEGPKS